MTGPGFHGDRRPRAAATCLAAALLVGCGGADPQEIQQEIRTPASAQPADRLPIATRVYAVSLEAPFGGGLHVGEPAHGYRLLRLTKDEATHLDAEGPICEPLVDVTSQLDRGIPPQTILAKLGQCDPPVGRTWPDPHEFSEEVRHAQAAVDPSFLDNVFVEFAKHTDRYADGSKRHDSVQWLENRLQQWTAKRRDARVALAPGERKELQQSVVFTLPGKPGNSAILLGAHLDAVEGSPGADDNASGVACLLEALRALLAAQTPLKRDLYFAFYAEEESGLRGSKDLAENGIGGQKLPIEAVLNLDMTGYFAPKEKEPTGIYFVTSHTDKGLTAFSRELARLYAKTEYFDTFKCGGPCSDHRSWYCNGVPTVYPFESSWKHGNHLRRHSSTDIVKHVNRDHMLRFVRLAVAFAVVLGEPV